jgi:hypothetical protein
VRIINSGKKKLVLDHLVVQQLGKEREEGEYENLILFGAEDITKIDEDASDMRVWTPKMIDDLIDDAEKEAEEAAREQEKADAAKAASQEEEEEDASKTRGFSFAKIWETKAKEVAEAADAAEPDDEPDFDEHGWVQFLQQAEATEAAQREAARAVAGRLRALKKIKYTMVDTTPEKKNKKGKGKDIAQSQSTANDRDDADGEFVPGPDFDVISDDDEDMPTSGAPSDLEDLSLEQRTVIGGMAAGKRKLTQHERALLQKWHSLDEKKRAEALSAAIASNSLVGQQGLGTAAPTGALLTNAPTSVPPAAAPSGPAPAAASQRFTPSWHAPAAGPAPGPGPATMAQRHALHTGAAAYQQSPLVAAAAAGEAIRRVANGESLAVTVAPAQKPSPSEPVTWPVMPMVPQPRHSEHVANGRAILLDLYRALQSTNDPAGYSADWGELARSTTPTATRKELYVNLGKIADRNNRGLNSVRRFSQMPTLVAAFYFIDSLSPIDPARPQFPNAQPHPTLPLPHHHPGILLPQGFNPPAPPANHAVQQPHVQFTAWAAAGYSLSVGQRPMPMSQPATRHQPVLYNFHQPTPQRLPQTIPQVVPQAIPQAVPQAMLQPVPQPVQQPLQQRITQVKASMPPTRPPQPRAPPQPLLTHQALPQPRSQRPSPITPQGPSTPLLQSPSSAPGTSSPITVPQREH